MGDRHLKFHEDRDNLRRHATVARMLAGVAQQPRLLMREVFPDEIVAAAALVAASLPGGEHLHAPASAALPAPAADLATTAHDALALVAALDGPWSQGWADEAVAAQARQTVDDLTTILNQSIKR